MYTVYFKDFTDWSFNWHDNFHSSFTGQITVALRGDSLTSKISSDYYKPSFLPCIMSHCVTWMFWPQVPMRYSYKKKGRTQISFQNTFWIFEQLLLTHWTPKLPLYQNQSIDLQSKSIDWFLYDGNFGVYELRDLSSFRYFLKNLKIEWNWYCAIWMIL